MTVHAFDTLKFVERLKEGGFEEQQAKTLSEIQHDIISEVLENYVPSKTENIKMESDIKADIAELRSELKSDMAELRSELKSEIKSMRIEFEGKFRLLNWMLGFGLSFLVAIGLKIFLA